jgi:hypothetical protein
MIRCYRIHVLSHQIMKERIIKLCYRKVIDASSQKVWDKYVFDSTYQEFLMQAQFYNKDKKFNSFAEIINNVTGAEKLHFLISSAIVGYLQQLKGMIPDVLNNIGKHFLQFKNYRFEIINSDIKNKASHQVAINFFSEPLIWHDTVGEYMLVSHLNEGKPGGEVLTDLVKLQPFITIYSLQTLDQ